MSEAGAGDSTQGRSFGGRVKHGFESKVLVPLAVAVVSAATSYLIKKLPTLIEEKLLPLLREPGGAGAVRDAVAATAVTVVERASDLMPDADGQAASSGEDGKPASEAEGDEHPAGQLSDEEREEERRKREERRRERKTALQKA